MWNKKKLGELCLIKSGDSNARDADDNGKYAFFDRSKKVKKSKRFLFDCEALIIPGEGKEFLPRYYKGKFDLHQRAYAIHQFKPELNIQYLFYYLVYNKNYFSKVAVGATVKSLRQRHFDNLEIYYPSLSEQQRIVAKLDAAFSEIDKMISLKKKSILNLDKFFSNQLNNLFLDNSNNWESTTLGTYYDVRDGTHDSPKYVSQGIPLVTSKNLKNGTIDLTKIRYIKNEDYLLIKKRSGVSIGDVLMAMIGTIGNPVIIKNDKEFAIKNVALFKVKENQSSDFLKYYLDTAFVKNKMLKDSKGTTQQFVGLGYLRNFPIKVPSFEQQQVISLKIMSLEKNIDDLKNKYNLILKNYISLKNSLLTELLNKSKAA